MFHVKTFNRETVHSTDSSTCSNLTIRLEIQHIIEGYWNKVFT